MLKYCKMRQEKGWTRGGDARGGLSIYLNGGTRGGVKFPPSNETLHSTPFGGYVARPERTCAPTHWQKGR
jgi:hypothetical protein